MPEDQGGQAPPEAPPEGTPPQDGTGAPETGAGGDESDPRVKRANEEAASYRRKLRDAEDRIKRFEAEQLTESERVQRERDDAVKERDEARAALRVERVRISVAEVAASIGFRNPSVAYRLLDPDKIDVGDDGTPKNVEVLLRDLAKKEPYLVHVGGADGGAGNGNPDTPSSMNDVIRSARKR